MPKKVIIHGHFYQPPRENPYSGLISMQESAAPEDNWNYRICRECYTPFGASQVLDRQGLVQSVINLYEYVSFNFGSSLLDWIEKYNPAAYEKILLGDKKSHKRLGYGNAIAMGYNHTILPLDNAKDARTQIRWGLADFRERFKRNSEGIWLPECAVNNTVLDILIDEGLKFIILSPWQAHSTSINGESFKELKNEPAPSDKPFLIERPSGSIAVFFYHPNLAANISFNHLLRSHEELKSSLKNVLSNSDMVSIATDGEIYGHHEPHGHMCLSHLIHEQIQSHDPELEFTNYSAVLRKQKLLDRAELSMGERGLGSSWSCSHGIERWTRNCGCSTGGDKDWNQEWRLPLRKSFNQLRLKAQSPLETALYSLTNQDPQELLEKYILVINGKTDIQDFAALNLIRNNSKNRESLLTLLESAKYLQFMYTSCAWFFSELTGMETIQNLTYALCAADLLEKEAGIKGLKQEFSESLNNVVGNLGLSARDIVEKKLIQEVEPHIEAASILLWHSKFQIPGQAVWGTWKLDKIHYSNTLSKQGHITIENCTMNRKYKIDFRLSHSDSALEFKGKNVVYTQIEFRNSRNRWQTVKIDECEPAFRIIIRDHMLRTLWKEFSQYFSFHSISPYLKLFSHAGFPNPENSELFFPIEMAVIFTLEHLTESRNIPYADEWQQVSANLREILCVYGKKEFQNAELIEKKFIKFLKKIFHHYPSGKNEITHILNILDAACEAGFNIRDNQIQESLFKMIKEKPDASWIDDNFLNVARNLGINAEMAFAN